MAIDAATGGYWLVAFDGGVFSFGAFYGSEGGSHLTAQIVGMVAGPAGNGYALLSSTGGSKSFGSSTTS